MAQVDGSDIARHVAQGNLVLFIGNGIRRVPTTIETCPAADRNPANHTAPRDDDPGAGPSWQKYMEDLWSLLPDRLPLDAFSRLSPPRQAEWFDREAAALIGEGFEDNAASIVRMHLLGRGLHPRDGVPTNSVLDALSEIVLAIARHADAANVVHVITTNVDCALEQNLAWRDEARPALSAIEVWTPRGQTATWRRRQNVGSGGATVRILKIHGCLGALKRSCAEGWRDLADRLAGLSIGTNWKTPFDGELAGHVPTDVLWGDSAWINTARALPGEQGSVDRAMSVFSFTEYVHLLDRLLQEARPPLPTAPHRDAGHTLLDRLLALYRGHPMLFVGYELHEDDVDVVVALHTTLGRDAPERFCLRFRPNPAEDRHVEERLKQLGVGWWPFSLARIAFAPLPGKLGPSKRHEWRFGASSDAPADGRDAAAQDALQNHWRRGLQQSAAGEWAKVQSAALRSVLGKAPESAGQAPPTRLVFAGLASVWHAFAVRQRDDFPSRRRVSAGLTAVDSQVPGGSGLVPAMVAAAIAGPTAIGHLALLANVARSWARWAEIEEFCLGAGLEVRPRAVDEGELASARTSHVLLYDAGEQDSESFEPRQRMIMDVDEAIGGAGTANAGAAALRVKPVEGFGTDARELLFADKLADAALLDGWQGPIVFETGTSGTELLGQHKPPTVWTAGFGSFVRTLVCARVGKPDANHLWRATLIQTSFGSAWQRLFDEAIDLRPFLELERPAAEGRFESYTVRVNSFNRRLGRRGATHRQEMAFGRRIQDRWHDLAEPVWKIVQPQLKGDANIGRGLVVTLHEAGLMALWELPGMHGTQSIVIEIATADDAATKQRCLSFTATTREPGQRAQGPDASVQLVLPADPVRPGTLHVGGEETSFRMAATGTRHTLGAGDTVRGCLAYGLWARYLVEEKSGLRSPASLLHVLRASCVLASLKCYAGSSVEFLRVVEGMRESPAWQRLWGADLVRTSGGAAPGG